MASTQPIILDQFSKGQFMSYTITTQAGYKVHVKLLDDSFTYVDGTKQSISIEPPLAQGSGIIQGDNLRIIIDIPESSNVQLESNLFAITKQNGDTVGFGYAIFVEDSNDNDYNDVAIMITAWQSKG